MLAGDSGPARVELGIRIGRGRCGPRMWRSARPAAAAPHPRGLARTASSLFPAGRFSRSGKPHPPGTEPPAAGRGAGSDEAPEHHRPKRCHLAPANDLEGGTRWSEQRPWMAGSPIWPPTSRLQPSDGRGRGGHLRRAAVGPSEVVAPTIRARWRRDLQDDWRSLSCASGARPGPRGRDRGPGGFREATAPPAHGHQPRRRYCRRRRGVRRRGHIAARLESMAEPAAST